MSTIKCKECGQDISIRSKQCINCGSTKPFKGYRFKRKELVDMGLSGYGDFRNFLARGGKVGSGILGKITKVALWCIAGYFIMAAVMDDVHQTENYYNNKVVEVK